MPRVKSTDKPVRPVADWVAADELIARIGDLQLEVADAEATAKDAINEAKLDLAEKVKPLHEAIDLNIRSLEVFAATHRDEFGKNRSRKLSFGTLGWRRSTSIRIKKKTMQLIKEIFIRSQAARLIRVKETVDKEALARLTDEQLAEVQARRESRDVFFVEPELPKAVDYG